MKGKTLVVTSITVALVTLLGATGAVAGPSHQPHGDAGIQAVLGTAFTYQGQLQKGGSPVNGTCDLQFKLYDAVSGGTQVGSTQTKTNVAMSEGLFAVELDFGITAFRGDRRWLEIAARCPAGSGSYTTLSPRQELTAAPYALSLRPGAEIAGSVSGDEALHVRNDSSATGSTGVFGWAYATSGETFGVWGTSRSTAGTGVYGNAEATSGTTYGVWGVSRSTSGRGVYGRASATSGTTYGVYGESASTSGRGVLGEATATSGTNYGGYFRSYSTAGVGVLGEAGMNSGETNGVYGYVASPDGHGVHGEGPTYGVFGEATRTSGEAWGVHGESASTSGRGVHGRATATSGITYGGRFTSDSTSGYGVYGHTTATSGTTYGVYGEAVSSSGYGVYGEAPLTGVYGEATHTSGGPSAGVFGVSASIAGTGVRGEATADAGETTGVFGESASNSGRGVYGWVSASSGTTYGVYGESASTSGRGVYGRATATSGQTAGVKGVSDSPDGWGGHFTNSSGVGLRANSDGGNLIEAWDTSPANRRFYISNTGEVYADGSFHPGGADLAEMLSASEGLEPGDVLVIGSDGRLERSTNPYATNVAGVHSTKPGFVGGSDEDGANPGKVLLAVVGVVPVKASAENGAIAPGDLLTSSSTPGHAMRADRFIGGAIIGKALEGLSEGKGVIRMLVMLQ